MYFAFAALGIRFSTFSYYRYAYCYSAKRNVFFNVLTNKKNFITKLVFLSELYWKWAKSQPTWYCGCRSGWVSGSGRIARSDRTCRYCRRRGRYRVHRIHRSTRCPRLPRTEGRHRTIWTDRFRWTTWSSRSAWRPGPTGSTRTERTDWIHWTGRLVLKFRQGHLFPRQPWRNFPLAFPLYLFPFCLTPFLTGPVGITPGKSLELKPPNAAVWVYPPTAMTQPPSSLFHFPPFFFCPSPFLTWVRGITPWKVLELMMLLGEF